MTDEQAAKRRPGRPRKYPAEGKRQNVTFRVRDETHGRLASAANSSGRSISEEMERRIEQSFEAVDLFHQLLGGAHNAQLISTIITAVRLVEIETGKKWTEDSATTRAVKIAIQRVMELLKEPADAATPSRADTLLGIGSNFEVGEQAGNKAVRMTHEITKGKSG